MPVWLCPSHLRSTQISTDTFVFWERGNTTSSVSLLCTACPVSPKTPDNFNIFRFSMILKHPTIHVRAVPNHWSVLPYTVFRAIGWFVNSMIILSPLSLSQLFCLILLSDVWSTIPFNLPKYVPRAGFFTRHVPLFLLFFSLHRN